MGHLQWQIPTVLLMLVVVYFLLTGPINSTEVLNAQATATAKDATIAQQQTWIAAHPTPTLTRNQQYAQFGGY